MVFARDWNASYEAAPADTDSASEGAERIRDMKTDVRERLDTEHYNAVTDGADQGIHKFPSGITSARPSDKTGRIYLNTEHETVDFYDGAAWQVVGIPKGTRMLFQQTAAPLGWTKDTTANLDDTALRIVVGAVGSETGGLDFATLFAAAVTTDAVDPGNTGATVVGINGTDLNLASAATDLNLSVTAHALTIAELPAHKHLSFTRHDQANEGDTYDLTNGEQAAANGKFVSQSAGTSSNIKNPYSEDAGSGDTHTHTLGGTPGSHSHTLSGTVGSHTHIATTHGHTMGTHTHDTAMNVNYHDVIIAVKD